MKKSWLVKKNLSQENEMHVLGSLHNNKWGENPWWKWVLTFTTTLLAFCGFTNEWMDCSQTSFNNVYDPISQPDDPNFCVWLSHVKIVGCSVLVKKRISIHLYYLYALTKSLCFFYTITKNLASQLSNCNFLLWKEAIKITIRSSLLLGLISDSLFLQHHITCMPTHG